MSNKKPKFTFTVNSLLLAELRASRLEKYKEALPPKTTASLEGGKATIDEVLRTLAGEVQDAPSLAVGLPQAVIVMLQAWRREQEAKS